MSEGAALLAAADRVHDLAERVVALRKRQRNAAAQGEPTTAIEAELAAAEADVYRADRDAAARWRAAFDGGRRA